MTGPRIYVHTHPAGDHGNWTTTPTASGLPYVPETNAHPDRALIAELAAPCGPHCSCAKAGPASASRIRTRIIRRPAELR